MVLPRREKGQRRTKDALDAHARAEEAADPTPTASASGKVVEPSPSARARRATYDEVKKLPRCIHDWDPKSQQAWCRSEFGSDWTKHSASCCGKNAFGACTKDYVYCKKSTACSNESCPSGQYRSGSCGGTTNGYKCNACSIASCPGGQPTPARTCVPVGPNYDSSGNKIPGQAWPAVLGPKSTAADCAARCENVSSCDGFHYYGQKDGFEDTRPGATKFSARGTCYLKTGVTKITQMNDNRDRYASVCRFATTTTTTPTATTTTCPDGHYKSSETTCTQKATATSCGDTEIWRAGTDSHKTGDDTACTPCPDGEFKKTSTTCAAMCNGKFDPDEMCGEKTKADCTGDLERVHEVVRKNCPVLCATCETKSCPNGIEDDKDCRFMHPADCNSTDDSLSSAMQAGCPVLCDVCATRPDGESKKNSTTTCEGNEWREPLDLANASSAAPCRLKTACSVNQFLAGATNETAGTCVEPCPTGTYQDQTTHHADTCTEQATCAAGFYYAAGDGWMASALEKMDAKDAAQYTADFFGANRATCKPCPDDMFQDQGDSREASCTLQVQCKAGERIANFTTATRATCTECAAGEHMDKAEHRETKCLVVGAAPVSRPDQAPEDLRHPETDPPSDDDDSTAAIIVVVLVLLGAVSIAAVYYFSTKKQTGGADVDATAYADPSAYADTGVHGGASAAAANNSEVYGNEVYTGDTSADIYADGTAPAARHDGTAAGILAAHSIGDASRTVAEAALQSRGCVPGDFVVRQSKGSTVLTIQTSSTKCVHHKIGEAGGVVTVDGKRAAVRGATTLVGAVQGWLSSPPAAKGDLQRALVDVLAPEDSSADTYGGDSNYGNGSGKNTSGDSSSDTYGGDVYTAQGGAGQPVPNLDRQATDWGAGDVYADNLDGGLDDDAYHDAEVYGGVRPQGASGAYHLAQVMPKKNKAGNQRPPPVDFQIPGRIVSGAPGRITSDV